MAENTLEAQVIEALAEIAKMLQNDGGDCKFIKMDDKIVYVELQGACSGCPHAQATLKNGVESYLRNTVDPEITVVRA